MASLLQIRILIFGLLVLCTSVNLNSTPGPTDCDSRYRKEDTEECAPHLYSREDKQIWIYVGDFDFPDRVRVSYANKFNSTPGPTDCDSRYRKEDTEDCTPHSYSREDKQIWSNKGDFDLPISLMHFKCLAALFYRSELEVTVIHIENCYNAAFGTTTPIESQNHYPALSIQSMCVSGIVTVPLITSMIVRHILTQQQAQILNQQEQVLDIWAYMEPHNISKADIVQLRIYAVKTEEKLTKEEILAYEKKKKSGRCAVPTKFALQNNGESLEVTVKDIFPPSQWTVHSSMSKNIALENIELGGLGGRCDFLFTLDKNAASNSRSHLIGVFDLAQKGNTHVVKAVCFSEYHAQPEEETCDTKYCQTQEMNEQKACDTKYCQTHATDDNSEIQDVWNMDKSGKDQMRETAKQSISILDEVPPILSSYCNGEVTSKNTLTNDNSMEMSIEKSGESQTREEIENVLKVVSPAAVASNDPRVVDEKDLDHEGLKQEEIQKWNETFAFEIPTLNGHTAESIFANF